jgi:hypothetical protein
MDRGACRMEGFVLPQDVPDCLGQLAGEIDPGDLRAALASESRLRPLIALPIVGVASGMGGGFDQGPAKGTGPFLARGPRRSLAPDWRTSGHSPVYPASFLGLANRPMSPISDPIV